MAASPDLEIDADEMVVNVLFHALIHGAPLRPQIDALPGWVFAPGARGYPIAIRTGWWATRRRR